MKKYTFDCKLLNGDWGNEIIILAKDKNEALEKLSKKYHPRIQYYSSDIKIEEVKNIKKALAEEQECFNNFYKENRIALGILIGGVASTIVGSQITIKNQELNKSKDVKNLSIEKLYETAEELLYG